MTIDNILKMGGYPNTPEGIKAFYEEYPTEKHFKMKFGGIANPQAPTADEFFSNTFAPNTPRGFYEEGGATNKIAFPQAPNADLFFSAYPVYAMGGGLRKYQGDKGGNSVKLNEMQKDSANYTAAHLRMHDLYDKAYQEIPRLQGSGNFVFDRFFRTNDEDKDHPDHSIFINNPTYKDFLLYRNIQNAIEQKYPEQSKRWREGSNPANYDQRHSDPNASIWFQPTDLVRKAILNTKALGGRINANMEMGGGLPGGPNQDAPCYECGGSSEEGGAVSAFNYGAFPAIMGQGGEEEYAKGGWIKKVSQSMEKRGTKGSFTKYCGGKVTDECIQRGLNSSNPKTRRRAALAKAFRSMSKKAEGGESGYGLDPNDVGSNNLNYILKSLSSNVDRANMDDMINEVEKYDDYMNAFPQAEYGYNQPKVYNDVNPSDMSSAWNAFNQASQNKNNVFGNIMDFMGPLGLGSVSKYKEFIPKKAQSSKVSYTDMPSAPYLPDQVQTSRTGGSLKRYQGDEEGSAVDENTFDYYGNEPVDYDRSRGIPYQTVYDREQMIRQDPYSWALPKLVDRAGPGVTEEDSQGIPFDEATLRQLQRMGRRGAKKMGFPKKSSDWENYVWDKMRQNYGYANKALPSKGKRNFLQDLMSRKKKKQEQTQAGITQGATTGTQGSSTRTRGTDQGTPSNGLTVTYGPMGRYRTLNEAYMAPQNVWASQIIDNKRGPFGIFGRNKTINMWHSPSMGTTYTQSGTEDKETETSSGTSRKYLPGYYSAYAKRPAPKLTPTEAFNRMSGYAMGGAYMNQDNMTQDYMQDGGESYVIDADDKKIQELIAAGIDFEYLD